MRTNIVRLLTTARLDRIGRGAIATRSGPTINLIEARWKSSVNKDGADDQEDQMFGVLRKRVFDKVGDNLEQIIKYNAYELFGIKQQFKVNKDQLQHAMHNLQRLLHPDRFINANKTSREKSDYLSAAVNDFYSILTNPYERGKYLLSLTLNKSPADIENMLDGLKMEDDFLADMMDIREKINDKSCDTLELRKLSSFLENEIEKLIGQLDRDFKSNNIDDVLKRLGKLKFLVNCHRGVSEKSESFSIY